MPPRTPAQRLQIHSATALRILAVTATYYGAGKLGLLEQLVRGQVTPLWPPTGIAVAALLVLGPYVWPGITLGAFLVNVWISPSPLALAMIVAGNTAAPLCTYLLLRRTGFQTGLDRLRDAFLLVFLGALGPMLISSTAGSAALVLTGALPVSRFWPTWSVWWTGDAMGVLVVAPLLFVAHEMTWPRDVRPVRWAEAAALAVGTLLIATVITTTSFNLLFLALPLLIWAAFRFQLAGAAPCALLISTAAVFGAVRHAGPFTSHDLFRDMVTLQTFNGSVALTALLLSALITERNHTQLQIQQLCRQLGEIVGQLSVTGSLQGLPSRLRGRHQDDS
ncbi:MAG: MASE1 domain-containing protein [Streptomycetaceae bacterium]|nr:MASE1 domain-containing protein [Streptomycetaceae bacterium]